MSARAANFDGEPFALERVPLPADHDERLDDPKRLAALALTGLMDAESDAAFDRFTRLAATLLGAPIALVSLVDSRRQFFKSALGLPAPWSEERETPLRYSFCQYVVSTETPLIVEDARQHPWLAKSPAIAELGAVAYAGFPLESSDQQVLGTLCVLDSKPRRWNEHELQLLRDLAAMAMTEIELRGRLTHLSALRVERGKERALLHAVLASMDDAIVVTHASGELMLQNPAARQGMPQGGFLELDGATAVADARMPARRALAGEHVHGAELMLREAGKRPRYLSINASPLVDASGGVYAAVSVGRDVTPAREAALALARSEAILKGVVHHLPNGAVLLFDHDLRFLMAGGQQLPSSIGLSGAQVTGKALHEVLTPMTRLIVEPHYRSALRGQASTFEMVRHAKTFAITTVPVRDAQGRVTAGLAMVYDVTTHKHAEAQVRREAAESRSQALRDELTGLYNRRGFLELSSPQLAQGRSALLFFVDLNGMKLINDQLGHEQGDRALIETAEVLRVCFRDSDILARLGGDEFVALLPNGDASQLTALHDRVEREIALHNADPIRAFQLSASIGAAVFDPTQPETIEALIARADVLMYEQKKSRRESR
jgi:diguanylate cyclase